MTDVQPGTPASSDEPDMPCRHPADHRCIDCATDDEMLAAIPPFLGGTW